MRRVRSPARSGGFTLFEMVVVICSIAILYLMAEQRINELPAAAERASFQGVLEQVKTGVQIEMVARLAGGNAAQAMAMAGANPMDFLLETPSNYLGETQDVTDALRRRNAWYFETSSGELVYLVGGNSIGDVWVTIAGVPVNLGQIRFRIENLHAGPDGRAARVSELPPASPGRWEGTLLLPVHEYSWDARNDLPVAIEYIGNRGG